jgi:hypothetical protein
MDLPLYAQVMAEYAQAMMKGQGLPIQIPPLKAEKGKGFLGVALTLQPDRGAFELWLPMTAVSELRKMAEPALKGAAGAVQ